MTSVINIQTDLPTKRQDSVRYRKTQLAKLDLHLGTFRGKEPRKGSRNDAAVEAKKRVRFPAEEVHTVALIPRWRDLPVAELWWTPAALDDIKRDWKFAVYKIEQGEAPEDGDARGLEQHTGNGAWEYFSAQTRARNAVLGEQERQSSCEEIAEVYFSETSHHAQKAIERAKLDAKEAKAHRLRKAEAVLLIKEAAKVKTIHNKKKDKSKDLRNKSPPTSLRERGTAASWSRSSRSPKSHTQKKH